MELKYLYSKATAFDYVGPRARISFGTWDKHIHTYGNITPIKLGDRAGKAHTLVFTRRMLDAYLRNEWPVEPTADELNMVMGAAAIRELTGLSSRALKRYYKRTNADGTPRLPGVMLGNARVSLRPDVEKFKKTLRGPGRPFEGK
ncbi:MAG: hypothetical protein GY803_23245 [Chloroflexi bacterium]|nr:hypothetical protein [Chloroflexota bacterium]